MQNLSDVVSITDENEYSVVLPKSNLVVNLRLLTGVEEGALNNQLERNRKQNSERLVTTQLAHMISSVNGNSTKEALEYVSHNIPSSDSTF